MCCLCGLLTGCSNEKTVEAPALLEVVIQTPETINVNEKVVIEALVTQGDENVKGYAQYALKGVYGGTI